ncbi:alpha/beta hydrolase [Kibdelosporangium lantanae]|uniref:Alpha/beta hydrolase n=1 Tax=Kibdelosporangium lantanae TaxID=1497396 RepID=A0ABW3M3A6_9PSEU
MPLRTAEISFRTLDGLNLAGTYTAPNGPVHHAVAMVHGGGVTREEGGFFTHLAAGLGEAGVATLRYDLRGHGVSEGRQQDNTLTAHLNDIRVALTTVRDTAGTETVSLLGASFGGGLCAYYAAEGNAPLDRLVLLNPQLNYKDRYIDQKPYWSHDRLNDDMARHLRDEGFIAHSSTVKHGRAMLNEVFWIRPNQVLGHITAPTLIVHGTKDTFVPIEASRAAAAQLHTRHKLVEIEGSQHGFAVHDDPRYLNPQSQEWQAFVIHTVTDWITTAG